MEAWIHPLGKRSFVEADRHCYRLHVGEDSYLLAGPCLLRVFTQDVRPQFAVDIDGVELINADWRGFHIGGDTAYRFDREGKRFRCWIHNHTIALAVYPSAWAKRLEPQIERILQQEEG